MPDIKLVSLVSTVSRLLHERSSTSRAVALGEAYRLISRYGVENDKSEEWCDHVLMLFLTETSDARPADRAA